MCLQGHRVPHFLLELSVECSSSRLLVCLTVALLHCQLVGKAITSLYCVVKSLKSCLPPVVISIQALRHTFEIALAGSLCLLPFCVELHLAAFVWRHSWLRRSLLL